MDGFDPTIAKKITNPHRLWIVGQPFESHDVGSNPVEHYSELYCLLSNHTFY